MHEKNRLRKTLPWLDTIQSKQDTEKFLIESENKMNHGTAIRMSIRAQTIDAPIIGVLSIEAIQEPKPKIGYWLVAAWEGKGIMTTALRQLIQETFSVIPIQCLYLYTASSNDKSKNIAKRLGFYYQGTRKASEALYGTLVDQDIFLKKRPD